jgi:hypothetical protein
MAQLNADIVRFTTNREFSLNVNNIQHEQRRPRLGNYDMMAACRLNLQLYSHLCGKRKKNPASSHT